MILYAVLAEASVAKLYLAGLVPGVLLALLFMAVIAAISLARGDTRDRAPVALAVRLRGLRGLLPPVALFLVVVGTIYAGWATPTEAASLGVLAALGLAAARRALTWQMLGSAFENTLRVTAMVMLIVLAAFFLNFVMVAVGLTGAITSAMQGLDLSPTAVMLLIIALYLVLGCFMETLSLMVATTPIVVPVVAALGYDPVWFGVLFMLLIEAALITPPIGVNLFVVQSVRGSGPIRDVIVGALPFLGAMIVMMLLLLAVPELALWLPSLVSP